MADEGEQVETSAPQSTIAPSATLLESFRTRLSEMERTQDELTEIYKRLTQGREEERLHLAQELHDGPVQELYGVLFDLDNLAQEVPERNSRIRLLELCETTSRIIRSLRAICGELRPPALAPFGLEVAIRSHAQRLRESHPGLDVQLDLMHDGLSLPEWIRLALFRIYQEAVNNSIQHAETPSIAIRLVIEAEHVVLEIQDNGRGFDLQESWLALARRGHLGLLGITERAAALGGHAEVLSAIGKGTTVRAIVPRPTIPVQGEEAL